MRSENSWCEHDDKIVRYKRENFDFGDRKLDLIIRVWACPECGSYGCAPDEIDSKP